MKSVIVLSDMEFKIIIGGLYLRMGIVELAEETKEIIKNLIEKLEEEKGE